jgi:hypothetical protein
MKSEKDGFVFIGVAEAAELSSSLASHGSPDIVCAFA